MSSTSNDVIIKVTDKIEIKLCEYDALKLYNELHLIFGGVKEQNYPTPVYPLYPIYPIYPYYPTPYPYTTYNTGDIKEKYNYYSDFVYNDLQNGQIFDDLIPFVRDETH